MTKISTLVDLKLKEMLVASAKKNKRSMSQEIAYRLEKSIREDESYENKN